MDKKEIVKTIKRRIEVLTDCLKGPIWLVDPCRALEMQGAVRELKDLLKEADF